MDHGAAQIRRDQFLLTADILGAPKFSPYRLDANSAPSGFSKHDLPNAWIDIHGNHEAVCAAKPRVGFPISLDPLHDGFVYITVSGSSADADPVDVSIVNGQVHIDTKRLIVAALLLAQQFPLERGKLWHGYPGDFDVTGWRVEHERPSQKKSEECRSLWHVGLSF
jgi:hypothetical protein